MNLVAELNDRIRAKIQEYARQHEISYEEAAQRAVLRVDGYSLDPGDGLTFELPGVGEQLLEELRRLTAAGYALEISPSESGAWFRLRANRLDEDGAVGGYDAFRAEVDPPEIGREQHVARLVENARVHLDRREDW